MNQAHRLGGCCVPIAGVLFGEATLICGYTTAPPNLVKDRHHPSMLFVTQYLANCSGRQVVQEHLTMRCEEDSLLIGLKSFHEKVG